MNAQRLLQHFDRIAEAPDAVPRLRRFILDLAVRGKLVEQDPGDEPASELLKRIRVEKARLVKAGEIRKERPLPLVEEDEAPYTPPAGWAWVRIRHVTSDRGQITPDKDFTYIDVTAINKEVGCVADAKVLSPLDAPSRARKMVRTGDVLYSCVRPYLLNIAVIERDIVPSPIASTAFAVLNGFGLVLSKYLWIALRSPFMVECVEAKMRGQAYPAINDSDFAILPLPLPPLAEQHRIVAKVDELMALCDRLEAAQAERECRRDRLAAASLNRLNNGADAESFRKNTRFHLRYLPRLTTRPEHIRQLRQTILNFAVRGKLVPQDPNDGPALDFDAGASPQRALPFEIPDSWRWSRLQSLGRLKGGGTPSKSQSAYWNGTIPWVSPKDMKRDYIETAQLAITQNAVAESAVNMIEPKSILFVVRGMILAHSFPVAIAHVALTINQDMKALVLRAPDMSEFILRALKGLKPQILSTVQRSSHGTCRIEGHDYRDLLVPVPPPPEQQRIVARVDELMNLCDQIEAGLTTTETTARCILEASLHRVLAVRH